MLSAIIVGLCVSLFVGATLLFGAWFSLNAENRNPLATAMPILMMIPRFFIVLGSFAVGIKLLGWDNMEAMGFITTLGGAWMLFVTTQVIYVQWKLRGRKYERSKVEKVPSKSVPIRYRTISDNALISYEARKRCGR